jgi:hypothetical protein
MEKVLLSQERKRKHELKEKWNVIFYLEGTGYQWYMLPKKDYSKWELAYYCFCKRADMQEFDLLLNNL